MKKKLLFINGYLKHYMSLDERYRILFEPLKIGPVTAPNRFYQVPHCNGMGYRDVSGMVALRAIKAEGGWGTVCTEQVEIHHTSEITPFIELRIWDDRDVPLLSRVSSAVHEYGSLAGIELAYNGINSPNFYSREVPLGPSDLPTLTFTNDPVQARAMTKSDISDLRRWHRKAALRAKSAGFDIIYVYGAHGFGAPQHFISRRFNHRTDEYGGSLKNRARLLVELIEDTKEAVGDTCAVACRIGVDELIGKEGIHREEMLELFSEIGDLPDLWDLTLCNWEYDSRTSRFGEEGHEEPFVNGFKQLTKKPVVGVGRFTSPDTMVYQIRRGILDLIGAARPSIADPFLPKKIFEDRLDDIRECIGCNICVSGDMTMSPIRCTQNPTMGEEWRRRWHPEKIKSKGPSKNVLIVGGGPAGMECARALGQRGYHVTLAEKNKELTEKNKKIIPKPTSEIDPLKVPDSAQARSEEVSALLLVIAYKGARSPKQNIFYDKTGAREAAVKLADLARRKGVSFSDLIKRFSDLPQQSKLPLLSVKNNLSEFLQPAMQLKVGQVSDPVDSPYGFLIFNRITVDAIRASHILISYKDALRSETNRDRRDARKLAEKILKEVKSGRDFAEQARKHSDGPSGPKGGELGRFERGQMVPEFDQVVFVLETGDISEVVETKFGYHIIKRTK